MRSRCDTSFLKESSDDQIHCICKACYNILDGKTPMNKYKDHANYPLIPFQTVVIKFGQIHNLHLKYLV